MITQTVHILEGDRAERLGAIQHDELAFRPATNRAGEMEGGRDG